MLRLFLAVPMVVLYTVVFALPVLVAGAIDRSGALVHAMARAWSRLVLWSCGVRVRVEGEGNVVPGPAVYAANHASALDIPVLFGHLPVAFRIIHKRSLYLVPGIGWALWLGGHVGIDRHNPFRARRSLAAAAARIHGGTSVVVFPEGTRSRDEKVQAFKRGSFHLAIEAGVPVVPISLVGVKRVVPAGTRALRPGLVKIRIHPALSTSGRGPTEAAALAGEARERIVAGCAAEGGPAASESVEPESRVG